VRGWDEMVPAHLNLITEARRYQQVPPDVFPLKQFSPVAASDKRTDAGILPGTCDQSEMHVGLLAAAS